MKAFIKHIATYFPEKSLSNQEISERFPEWDSEKIIQKIGVRNRFNSGEDEFVSDMATKVSEKLFADVFQFCFRFFGERISKIF